LPLRFVTVYISFMASLIIAAWTWTIATVAVADNPRWALVMAAIGGFAVGAQLMGHADEHWWRTRRSRIAVLSVRNRAVPRRLALRRSGAASGA
jgi:hypothetical protein